MRTFFLLALAACSSSSAQNPAPPPAPAPASAAPSSTEGSVGAPGTKDLDGIAHVVTQMRTEQAKRPAVKVPAEKLFAELDTRGIQWLSKKQVLAATAQAQYCALGVTQESVAVAICEYASADAARAGKKMMDARYAKLVPDAERRINGSTLVTVANGRDHREIRDRVLDTFMSL